MGKDNFDKFVDHLQKELMRKELMDYNKTIVNLFHNPKNWGRLPENETSVSQSYKGPCGDTMEYFLSIDGNIIKKATFITDGCGASVATASQTTILIKGRTLEYAEKLTPKDLDDALDGLPEDHKHCAELSIRTLRRAIAKHKKIQISEG
ncbi:MAG: iron-sulfur cluster assembly scaffold protein [Candidatus Thorarchaeota archaeon]